MNHKRGRPKNRRAGCLMCKFWKMNGWGSKDAEKNSDARRRDGADRQVKEFQRGRTSMLCGSR